MLASLIACADFCLYRRLRERGPKTGGYYRNDTGTSSIDQSPLLQCYGFGMNYRRGFYIKHSPLNSETISLTALQVKLNTFFFVKRSRIRNDYSGSDQAKKFLIRLYPDPQQCRIGTLARNPCRLCSFFSSQKPNS
jgi:hypothetical protein